MAFIKFKYTGKSFEPKCSINKRGTIAFNEGAKKRYNTDNFNYVELYYDKENNKIAIKLLNDIKQDGILKLRQRKFGSDIGAKNFLDFFNIPFKKTKNFKINYDKNNDYLIFNLNEGIERNYKKRKKRKRKQPKQDLPV